VWTYRNGILPYVISLPSRNSKNQYNGKGITLNPNTEALSNAITLIKVTSGHLVSFSSLRRLLLLGKNGIGMRKGGGLIRFGRHKKSTSPAVVADFHCRLFPLCLSP
jgi:hypothetical protein